MPLFLRRRSLAPLGVAAVLGCNGIAGIGEPILESDGDATTPVDASTLVLDGNVIAPPPSADGGDASDSTAPFDADIADTNIPDTNLPDTNTPPPPASKPGLDVTAGGTYGKSATFSLLATVGESPGGNNVGASSHFVLKAGVVAATQSK